MDKFNIFSESMMTCLEGSGSYFETEAINIAIEQSRTIAPRWVVHDYTGKAHYVAACGKLYMVGAVEDEVYQKFIERNAYLKERLDHFSNKAIEAQLILGKIKMMIDGLQWELQNHMPDITHLRQIVSELLPPEINHDE